MWNKDSGKRALAFLKANKLPADPVCYRFAWLYATGTEPVLSSLVRDIQASGMRIGTDDIAALMRMAGLEEQTASRSASPVAAMDRILDETLEQTRRTTRTTGEFRDYLAGEMKDIGDPTSADIIGLVGRLTLRAERAEAELSAATSRIEELSKQVEEAKSEAGTDELSNLPNRRGIDAVLGALDDARANGSVAMVDIDHFKAFNDRYGHDTGDQIIRLVADVLRTHLAPHTVARWGGEEFLVVAPEIDSGAMHRALELARDELRETAPNVLRGDRVAEAPTFSAGIARLNGSTSSAIRRADEALYKAKRNGRDRIEMLGDTATRAA